MKVLTGSEMAAFDKYCIDRLGVPGLLLMEHAGLKVVEVVERCLSQFFDDNKLLQHKRPLITVVCGSGNNGGDGFVIARHLILKGYKVYVGMLKDSSNLKGDALLNYNLLKTVTGYEPFLFNESNIEGIINKSSLVVDALFGTGLSGELRGLGRKVVEAINIAVNDDNLPVIAVDIPSGLNADDGVVAPLLSDKALKGPPIAKAFSEPLIIKALKTVTMGLPKRGFFTCESEKYLGELIVADIGFPVAALKNRMDSNNLEVCLADEIKKSIPSRDSSGHKGTFGRLLLIGGSKGMAGAIAMSARAALKGGAGLVMIGVPHSVRAEVAVMVPEAMTFGLADENGVVTQQAVEEVLDLKWKFDVVLLGPGMGRAQTTMAFVKDVISKLKVPVILDADALFVEKLSILIRFRAEPTFLTPHEGEASKILTGIGSEYDSTSSISGRIKRVSAISRNCDSITVLKGAFSLISDIESNVSINPTGNSGMATAGSGDVLAGILAAFVGHVYSGSAGDLDQPVSESARSVEDNRQLAVAAVYVHGLAGDLYAKDNDEHSLTATAIIDYLPKAFRTLSK